MQIARFNRLGQFGIGLWASGMILAVACLMVSHWVILPHPQMTDKAWSTQLNQTLAVQSEQWTALHFLYGNCPCSRRILSHLVNRFPIDGCRERIVFIGEDGEMTAAARKRGYEVDEVTPEGLKTRYGVEAAPLLTVLDPSGNIRFAGGYTTHKQGPQIQDVNIIHQLLRGEIVGDLPLFGCAVSNELKSLVDPLGLKN
ncbi:MAG: hypothetical protein SFV81_27975 [Pirellulaceae bacterium]|nr:hypothetical protein [Pirellulaceae bacterium]